MFPFILCFWWFHLFFFCPFGGFLFMALLLRTVVHQIFCSVICNNIGLSTCWESSNTLSNPLRFLLEMWRTFVTTELPHRASWQDRYLGLADAMVELFGTIEPLLLRTVLWWNHLSFYWNQADFLCNNFKLKLLQCARQYHPLWRCRWDFYLRVVVLHGVPLLSQ